MKDEGKKAQDLRERTKSFSLRIIRLYGSLPKTTVAQVIGKQLLRSGTSPGAHYREAHRSRSTAEFISKIGGGLQELEETSYWLELSAESQVIPARLLEDLQQETGELIAIFASVARSAKKNQ